MKPSFVARLQVAFVLAFAVACHGQRASEVHETSIALTSGARPAQVAALCSGAHAASTAELASLLSRCLERPVTIPLSPVELDAHARAVQASYVVGSQPLGVLAWIDDQGTESRLLALSASAAEPPALSLRRERLGQEAVLVAETAMDCVFGSQRLGTPAFTSGSQTATPPELPAPKPDDCATRVESVWARRGSTLHRLGVYPTQADQWLGSLQLRHFEGSAHFEGERVRVQDRVTWRWFSGKSRKGANGGVEQELRAESASEAERVFRLNHDALLVESGDVGSPPAQGVPREAWIATHYAVGMACTPEKRPR